MTRLAAYLHLPAVAIIVMGGVGAVVLTNVEPMVGRPSGQPALVSDQAASRLAPTGFDQAQGENL